MGRRDASEEGRQIGNQYVSTTHPIGRDATKCDYDYIPVCRVTQNRGVKEKKNNVNKQTLVEPKRKEEKKKDQARRRGAKIHIHIVIHIVQK